MIAEPTTYGDQPAVSPPDVDKLPFPKIVSVLKHYGLDELDYAEAFPAVLVPEYQGKYARWSATDPEVGIRRCCSCQEWLPLSEFPVSVREFLGRGYWCLYCHYLQRQATLVAKHELRQRRQTR